MPKVSIGLPVYNGAQYLAEAIDSILCQSFIDFELIISDNASSDQTRRICESFQDRDGRVKYYRCEVNKGAAWNFNRVFHLASGQYFKWAAHDDILAPDFLMRCAEILDNDDSTVLCQTGIQIIGEEGKVLNSHQHGSDTTNKILLNSSSFEAHLRFAALSTFAHPCIDVFGLIRRETLAKTPLIADYLGSDRNLLAELALHGRFTRIPEYMFFSRMHEGRSIKIKNPIDVTRWFNPKKTNKVVFPAWKNIFEYIKTVYRFKLPLKQKIMCFCHLSKWLVTYRRRLITDIKFALENVLPEYVLSLFRFVKKYFNVM